MKLSFSNILKPENFRSIWNILTEQERKTGFFILVLMLIGVFLETIGVGMVIPALALFTQKNIAVSYPSLSPYLDIMGNPSQTTLVIGGLVFLFFIYFIKAIFLFFLIWSQNRFTFAIGERLSELLFRIYLQQPYTFHLQRNSALLIRNITDEVGVFTSNVLTPMLQILTESLTLLCICMLLMAVEPIGTITIVLVLGLASLVFVKVTKHNITRWGKARQHHEGLRAQHLHQGLGGVKDVKLLGREEYFLNQYQQHNSAGTKVRRLNATIQQAPRLWLELLSVGGLIVLVFTMLFQGEPLDNIVPKLGVFAVATFRMMPSVNRMLTSIQSLQYCLPVIDILGNDFNLSAENKDISHHNKKKFDEDIELRNISFSYPGATTPAINNISLTIKKGESIGFMGPSGSGKSTLVDIILGLITPDSGTVYVDGKNVTKNMREWQNLIGYVPQSIYLTDDDLAHNIAFGLPDNEIHEERIWKAIKAANLENFVRKLPDGIKTFVGERGVRLSGGQRQRIGIARALYHDPEVVVLDEATSALDNETELAVMDAVKELQGSKTLIIVAHRLSTIEQCDNIYKINEGKIEASGSLSSILHRSL
ncbi:ABC transporter ATP-binding protein [Prosthecochloris vibrioformis]|uniref:ABC transporter ATP-binding protein n=1 Tax=Prosthecochloris vibrioformis TaxID=1098 RepID=A0A5C4S143_PROVB|nr:ABC transporter ATP-binding protein [Prosthecochloris vibrioformis]TNJ37005.1 ABC transporter ATP-binding protein [Prosthecochloris vibrioformis]